MDRSSVQEEELFNGRRNSDVEKLWTDSTSAPEDGVEAMLEALQRIKESEKSKDTRLVEVEKILKNIVSMSHKYSQSEAMLTFFQTSSLDSVQPFFQSPVTVADIWRSNGFCLANTETILYDAYLSKNTEELLPAHSARSSSLVLTRTKMKHKEELECNEEMTLCSKLNAESGIQEPECIANTLQSSINNWSFFQLEACETDILE